MKTRFLLLLAALIPVVVLADVTVSWTAPTLREDGEPLPSTGHRGRARSLLRDVADAGHGRGGQ
jgi:hypothetical protein